MRELTEAELELVAGGTEGISGDPVRDDATDPLHAWAVQFRAAQAAQAETAGLVDITGSSDMVRFMRRLPGMDNDQAGLGSSEYLAPIKDGPIVVTRRRDRPNFTPIDVERAFDELDDFDLFSSLCENALAMSTDTPASDGLGADELAIEITININRALTEEELAAIAELEVAIEKATIAVNSIPATALITLPNGQAVTGLELQQLWRRTDFIINEAGTTYNNGTQRGQADYKGGNPIFSFNIDLLSGYTIGEGGSPIPGAANFLVLHELGHVSTAGRASNIAMYDDGTVSPEEDLLNERLANDIARAVAAAGGIPIIGDPVNGYTDGPPLVFN